MNCVYERLMLELKKIVVMEIMNGLLFTHVKVLAIKKKWDTLEVYQTHIRII